MSSLIEMRDSTEWVIAKMLAIQSAFGSYREFSIHNAEGWRLSQLVKMIDSLDQFLPFKVGDKIALAKSPKCEGGWWPSRKCLVKGATGIVKYIDFSASSNKWAAYIELDHETWVGDKGKEGEISSKHVFGFGFDYLVKVSDD
jgi:hypothetical protein